MRGMRAQCRRMAPVAAVAAVLLVVLALLGMAMMPRWQVVPFTDHIAVASADPSVEARGVAIPHQGAYRTTQRRLTVTTEDGTVLPAILRAPAAPGAPGAGGAAPGAFPDRFGSRRPACLFIHGSGTSGEQDFGDIANAMASAGIVTLVPAKRLDGYGPLHRDYARFAHDYAAAFDLLRAQKGVDPGRVGLYAESEGTWIATVLDDLRPAVAFAILSSAPVVKGRELMAMAMSAYAAAAGAPRPVIDDTAKLASLDFAPYGLGYADFDAGRHRTALTMPLLVNYGTLDPAMPVEQGARTLMDEAAAAGNRNVTVRYFKANHQMRAGAGLFTPGLPLAAGYTAALCDWTNGVAAGAGTGDWATPQVAGATPRQRYVAPAGTRSGILGSLGVLSALVAGAVLLPMTAGLVAAAMMAVRWLRVRVCGRRVRAGGDGRLTVCRRGRSAPCAVMRGGRVVKSDGGPMVRHVGLGRGFVRFRRADVALLAVVGLLSATLTLALGGYLAVLVVQALHGGSAAPAYHLAWGVLQAMAVACAVPVAWLAVRTARAARTAAHWGAARWAVAVLVLLGALCALTGMAFWELYAPAW